jgi:hypothetical protein
LLVGLGSGGPLSGVAILPGNGDNTFGPETDIDLVKYAESLAFADVNGDGLPDIVGCGITGDIGIALGTSARGVGLPFAAAQQYWVGAFCFNLFAGKINADVGRGILTVNVSAFQNNRQTASVAMVLDPAPAVLPPARNEFLQGRRTQILPGRR